MVRQTSSEARPAAPSHEKETTASPFPAALIERWLGRAPSAWTADDLLGFARAHAIRLVSLMHVSGDGLIRTLDFVPRDEAHFLAILNAGERADGSSLFPGIETGASDVVLIPRLDTAFVDPFSPRPTLALLCGHAGADRRPLAVSPDTIVRRAHARLLAETGIDLCALGEVEFFLGRPAGGDNGGGGRNGGDHGGGGGARDGRNHGGGGRDASPDDRNYHAASPFAFGEELRRLALCHLGEMGVPVKYGHCEVGAVSTGAGGAEDDEAIEWEQHEVELALAPLPAAANAVMLTEWVLRNLAKQHGLKISFDPMLREGHPGNGLHFHLSPRIGGRHADVIDTGGELTEPARWLIGGLVETGGALMAFGNRGRGSFLRLNQGREAPTGMTWGHRDRKALIRIPIVAQDSSEHRAAPPTVEFRLPDGSAHQHLLLAGIAQAVLVGREDPEATARALENTTSRPADGAAGEHPAAIPSSPAAPTSWPASIASSSASIPSSPAAIAVALERKREKFEAGNVFPAPVIDNALAALRNG